LIFVTACPIGPDRATQAIETKKRLQQRTVDIRMSCPLFLDNCRAPIQEIGGEPNAPLNRSKPVV
jgi:hypothetical protein